MTATHTPGPWIVDADLGIYSDQCPHCAVEVVPRVHFKEDAALISAAPDLLESLKDVFQMAAIFNHDADPVWAAVRDRAKSAIAKAEGRA